MKYGYLYERDEAGKVRLTLYHSTRTELHRPFMPHRHTECELALILSGSGLYTVQNKSYRFGAGDLFLFRGDELHCITEIDANAPFDVMNLHFEPSFVWSRDGLNSRSLWRLFVCRSPKFENKIDSDNPQTVILSDKFREIERELREQKFEYGLRARMLLAEILLILCRDYGYIDTERENGAILPNGKPEKAAEYIGAHLGDKMTLAELAAVCGMNRTYFCGMFKRCYGVTPFEYITVKRVEKAERLLKTTDRTCVDIAEECGFFSMSNFYKAYAAVMGKAPREK